MLCVGGCAAWDALTRPVPQEQIQNMENIVAELQQMGEEIGMEKVADELEKAEAMLAEWKKNPGAPLWLQIVTGVLGVVSVVTGGKAALIAGTAGRIIEGVQKARRRLPPEMDRIVLDELQEITVERDAKFVNKVKEKRNLASVSDTRTAPAA